MKTPPFLLGTALLFWGWQTNYLVLSLLLAVILEGARGVRFRWAFSHEDFNRLWNFCSLLFMAAAVYAFTTNEGPAKLRDLVLNPSPSERLNALAGSAKMSMMFFRWFPIIFFLFVAAQAYSEQEYIEFSTFSLLLRRLKIRARQTAMPPRRGLNTAYPYLAICLFSASATLSEGSGYYVGLAVVLSWALWSQRSRQYSLVRWAILLSLAIGLGFVSSHGLYQLQKYADNMSLQWLADWFQRGFDPKESRTALGQITRLKQSGKIRWRIETLDSQGVPLLLREACYQTFRKTVWLGAGSTEDFRPLFPDPNETSWPLVMAKANPQMIRIAGQLSGGRGLLPVPQGCTRLDNFAAYLVTTNRLGSVRMESGAGLVIYDVDFGPGTAIGSPPGPEDLQVSEEENTTLGQVIDQNSLWQPTIPDILRRVQVYFQKHYQYSLSPVSVARGATNQTPLEAFLTQTHAGHCEYFATATVLLLRKMGIHARYAAGYAVYENHGRMYYVRNRHAHAWCQVYVNDHWQDFDTTPSAWMEADSREASVFEFFTDLWSGITFQFSRFRWGFATWRQYLFWFFVPVLVVLLVQLWRRKGWKRRSTQAQARLRERDIPGLDSEWYGLEQKLAARHWPRPPHMTICHWLKQLGSSVPDVVQMEILNRIRELHYRYRFDPNGLDPVRRRALQEQVADCERDGALVPSSRN
jgi:protein-glutamine gamma-glutamyltransferase